MRPAGRTPFPRTAACLLAAACLFGSAQAEYSVIGEVHVEMGGESRIFYSLAYDDGIDSDVTSTYDLFLGSMFFLEIQAHATESFQVEGTLSFQGTAYNGIPSDCPCVLQAPEVQYFASSSMFRDVYMVDDANPDAELVLNVFEPVGDDAYRAEGTLRATLYRYPDFMDEPDLEDVLVIEGTFRIERIPRIDLD